MKVHRRGEQRTAMADKNNVYVSEIAILRQTLMLSVYVIYLYPFLVQL